MKKYYITATLGAMIAFPAIVGIGSIAAVFTFGIGLLISFAVIIILWVRYLKRMAKSEELPEKISQILLPVFIFFAYYMLLWIIFFHISDYSYNTFDSNIMPFAVLTFPYFAASFLISLAGIGAYFPIMYSATTLVMLIPALIVCRKKISFDKLMFASVACIVFLAGVSVFQFHVRGARFVNHAGNVQTVSSEVDMRKYRPFDENTYLTEMPWKPTIVFTENFPKLDGATAAYPMFAAIAQGLYSGLDERTVVEYVSVSRTDAAYDRLIDGEIDIFFGAQPSRQQLAAAERRGLEFTMTPIAKEAFVFFVHRDNPVDSLTLEQIQDIYQRRITNWRQAGGRNKRILPFQRPENSGSQTIMLAAVMGDKPMSEPLQREIKNLMGGAVTAVAEYRNYSSAIGYSFRYFVTGMRPHDDIKILAIDGIAPTPENIRNGTYPFTVNVYAVTIGSTNENTDKLIEWILSEQGQDFIELCGIVPTKTGLV